MLKVLIAKGSYKRSVLSSSHKESNDISPNRLIPPRPNLASCEARPLTRKKRTDAVAMKPRKNKEPLNDKRNRYYSMTREIEKE
jgi:hypothetical protein